MEKSLGALEVICDAPPYPIVEASKRIGYERPADVRWEQVVAQKVNCCRGTLGLATFRFTYDNGAEVMYAMAQCPCCKKVSWKDVPNGPTL